MAIVAVSQITLVDLSDAKSIQVHIASNQPQVQIYDEVAGTYTPNWAVSGLQLTPSAFLTGTTADIIGNMVSIEWYKDGILITSATPNHSLGANGKLTVNGNVLENSDFVRYEVKVVYQDQGTGLALNGNDIIEFAKIKNGTTGENAQLVYQLFPDGTVFKNAKPGETKRIQAVYLDGGTEVTNNLVYKWFYADPEIVEGSPNYDPDGGEGWALISNTNNHNNDYTGYGSRLLFVKANGVDSSESFKVVVRHGTKAKVSSVGTLIDVTDPHQVVIEGDNIFKNGAGELKLKARVFLDGEEITDLTGYTFNWKAYDEEGALSSWTGNTQSVIVDRASVTEKGYFTCDVYLT